MNYFRVKLQEKSTLAKYNLDIDSDTNPMCSSGERKIRMKHRHRLWARFGVLCRRWYKGTVDLMFVIIAHTVFHIRLDWAGARACVSALLCHGTDCMGKVTIRKI